MIEGGHPQAPVHNQWLFFLGLALLLSGFLKDAYDLDKPIRDMKKKYARRAMDGNGAGGDGEGEG